MRFRFKVFLLIVLVAVLATGVAGGLVAWRVDQAAQSSVRTEQSTIESLTIALERHAEDRASWSGVEAAAKRLHAKTGERIRLTTMYGDPVVDTADGDTPPSNRQPTLLRPRLPMEDRDDSSYKGRLNGAGDMSTEVVAERIEQIRGEARMDHCLLTVKKRLKSSDTDDDIETSTDLDPPEVEIQSTPGSDGERDEELAPGDLPQCRGVDKATETERRDDREAAKTCDAAGPGPGFRDGCLYQVFQQRTSDISPEPLLLYVGTQRPFEVTYPATQLFLLGLLLVAVVVVVSALLSRRVIRPIDSLITASKALSAGDLKARVSIRGHDELSRLGDTFNKMVDSLETVERQRRQLIADSAHELRTPLSNIHGYLEAFADGVLPADAANIDSLREESQLLARIVDDLRLLALSDAGQLPCDPIRLDVAVLLRGCRSAHQAAAEAAEVRLTVVAPPRRSPVFVDADPDRMRQALGNLIGNALHVTPPRSRVTLRATATDATVVIEVADTGGGIDAEHLPRIFDRFWRADPSRSRRTGGSGLGLAIAREIVAAHDGDLTAANRDGGAVFTVTLPRAGLWIGCGAGQ